MKLKMVKVGAIYYGVSEVERLVDPTGAERLNGHIDHDASTIMLDSGLSGYKHKEVLWHEVVHAIGIHFGIEGELNEHLVACMARGICMVLEDNTILSYPIYKGTEVRDGRTEEGQ